MPAFLSQRSAAPSTACVSYGHWLTAEAMFRQRVESWLEAHPGGSVCDVGGGANPALPETERRGRHYVVADIDPAELLKCPAGVETVAADLAADDFAPFGTFDLVISRTVAEHVRDPVAFHRNVRTLLADGGSALHYFPTLWALPFVANRLLPEAVTEGPLLKLQPNRVVDGPTGKFPAFYRWCRGPSRRQMARFSQLGYAIEEYVGFFGHGYYVGLEVGGRRPVDALEEAKTRFLLRHPRPSLTAYAIVHLVAPGHARLGGDRL